MPPRPEKTAECGRAARQSDRRQKKDPTRYVLEQLRQALANPAINLAVTATQVYVVGQFYNNLVFNHTASAFVWLIITVVLAAAPEQKRLAQRRPKPAPPRRMGGGQVGIDVIR
jgi:hypothetical protein